MTNGPQVGSGSVFVIDTMSKTVVATVTVGSRPGWVAITPDGAFAYVSNRGPTFGYGNVSVIAGAGLV